MPPTILSEDDLDRRYGTKGMLPSGGEYGCLCLIIEGNQAVDGDWLSDRGFAELKAGHDDIGTVAIVGDLTTTGDLAITDRLMCLIVIGDLVAPTLTIRETEVLVCGNLVVDSLDDHDNYVTVRGSRRIKTATE